MLGSHTSPGLIEDILLPAYWSPRTTFGTNFQERITPVSECSEARGRRSSYPGGSASDQSDLVAEFARAIHLCDAAAGAGAEVRVCLSNIHGHRHVRSRRRGKRL